MTHGREFLRPDNASLSRVKTALHSVDRSDEKAVWAALLSAAPSVGKIPLLAKDDENTFLTGRELRTWKIYFNNIRRTCGPPIIPPLVYLPGLEKLNFGGPYLDASEWANYCNKPSADMADMFIESAGKKVGFSRWPEVISLLDILCRSIPSLPEEPSMPPFGWFQNRVDRCVPEIIDEESESDFLFGDIDPYYLQHCTPHPFISHSSNLIETPSYRIFRTRENEYLPLLWKESIKQFGDVAANWHDILSQNNDSARAAIYTPTFVIVKQRLHLFVRSEHGYSLLHVPRDFEVWRQLISLSLYHPSTEQNGYLRAIQWELMCEEEPQFVGPMPEMRALQFLENTCQSLDGLVEVSDDYFIVKGKSSLYYTVKPVGRASNVGIEVRAFRNKEQTVSAINGVRICIVFGDYIPLPLGDKIAAFLLTLSDDIGSAANISTLQNLHHTWFQSYLRGNGEEIPMHLVVDGWKQMLEEFPHGFQEDEPEWDDEWEEGEEIELDIPDNEEELVDAIDNDSWELEAEARGEAHCI
ncbi:MAG: hypothetical protein QF544_04165 [Candidatus Thalassarchaeaceae archaeon]|nr:hypothetical protein [Candidatus Thalassarchaeaceae archaeon]